MIKETTVTKNWASMLRISKSQLQTYLICPRKFEYQYVIGAPWEFMPASLPFGKALHAAAAYFYQTLKQQRGKPALSAIVSEFRAAWENEVTGKDIRYGGDATQDSLAGLGIVLLKAFYEQVHPRNVEAVEYPFCVPISDPDGDQALEFSLVGVIDLIESDEEGNFIVSELKTSSKRFADSQAENQLDGLIYAYALDHLGFRTDTNRTLIRYDVLVKTKKPAFQQVYFNRESNDYRRLTRWIKEILQAIDRESFYQNYGWACKQCPFRTACWSR